ncbi:DNA polymerase [Clostridia bacterium]|nr:DNA polymerase [Clostridia bacterium]
MLKYWLWLTTLPFLSYAKIPHILSVFGTPEDVFFARQEDFNALGFLNSDEVRSLSSKSTELVENVLERCQRGHIRPVTMQDAEYPPALLGLDDAPGVLYVKGQLSALSIEPAIGVVGTRNPSQYGITAAGRFGYHLAKAGMTIVSGMAMGIDAAAHIGALRADNPTVAVLGCGVDVIYPPKNESLYYDIADRGAIISEFMPGSRPLGEHFPRRNRLISGLSLGVLVVEAPMRSGALITADRALDQGRDVFVIPGPIDAPNSAGCNHLIREYATLVTDPTDILKEYADRYAVAPEAPKVTPTITAYEEKRPQLPKPKPPDLSVDQVKIYDALATPKTPDQLIGITGLTMQALLGELTLMEVEGLVKRSDIGTFSI